MSKSDIFAYLVVTSNNLPQKTRKPKKYISEKIGYKKNCSIDYKKNLIINSKKDKTIPRIH